MCDCPPGCCVNKAWNSVSLFSCSNEHCYIRKPNSGQRESTWLSANKKREGIKLNPQLVHFTGEIDHSIQIEFSGH